MTKLFVYGSLKRGFFNHNRAGFGEHAKFLGPAIARGVALRRIGFMPYPHAIEEKGSEVKGELYEVDPKSDTMGYITQMELGAGYKEHEVRVEVEGASSTALMFVSARPITEGVALREWTKDLEGR